MEIYELPTPTVLVDLDRLDRNIHKAAEMARRGGKVLWPMFKTSKSSFIAGLQADAGAEGFLVGSITEAEILVDKGVSRNIMIAYPIADRRNIERILGLSEKARIIVRVDNLRQAELLDEALGRKRFRMEYCVKIDVGYHRLGVKPEDAGIFAQKLKRFSHLEFTGLVTHQGNAYNARRPEEVEEYARSAAKLMEAAVKNVRRVGLEPEIVGAGSTPTFRFDVKEPIYTHLFPGNYVYYDRTQALIYGSAELEDCALSLLTTVLSKPQHSRDKLAVIDAGGRYFDKEIRGGIMGYGEMIEHKGTVVVKVSQEIALVNVGEGKVEVGEKARIITNHSCYTNNAAEMLVAYRNGTVEGIIPIDAREEETISLLLASRLRTLT